MDFFSFDDLKFLKALLLERIQYFESLEDSRLLHFEIFHYKRIVEKIDRMLEGF